MGTITADYGAMERGRDDLTASWQRIEAHLADLDAAVAQTGDLQAAALQQYLALKAKWSANAAERQIMLRRLTELLDEARRRYAETDAMLAAQFAG